MSSKERLLYNARSKVDESGRLADRATCLACTFLNSERQLQAQRAQAEADQRHKREQQAEDERKRRHRQQRRERRQRRGGSEAPAEGDEGGGGVDEESSSERDEEPRENELQRQAQQLQHETEEEEAPMAGLCDGVRAWLRSSSAEELFRDLGEGLPGAQPLASAVRERVGGSSNHKPPLLHAQPPSLLTVPSPLVSGSQVSGTELALSVRVAQLRLRESASAAAGKPLGQDDLVRVCVCLCICVCLCV